MVPVRIVYLVGQTGFKPGDFGDNCLDIRLKTRARFG